MKKCQAYCADCGALVSARTVVSRGGIYPYAHKRGGWRYDGKGKLTVPPLWCTGNNKPGQPALPLTAAAADTLVASATAPKPPGEGEIEAAWERDIERFRAVTRLYYEAHFDANVAYYQSENGPAKNFALSRNSAWSQAQGAVDDAFAAGRKRRPWTLTVIAMITHHFSIYMKDPWGRAVLEDVRRRLEGYDGPLPEPVLAECPETFDLAGVSQRCTLPRDHGGDHHVGAATGGA